MGLEKNHRDEREKPTVGADASDEKLMLAYQAGDVRAFEVLVRRHRRPVFNFCLRIVGQRERAEDLVQETFLKMAKNASAFRERAKLKTWMYTIARNLCIDELRKMRHRNAASLDRPAGPADEDPRPLVDRVASADAGPDRAAEAARLKPLLVEALAALPDEQREVFVLREYAGVPFKEIAEITGTPVNTVKSRMRYALEGLRRYLSDRGVTAQDLWQSPAGPEVLPS